MRQQNPILMSELRGDYQVAKQLGAPLLACQGMLVPRGAPEMRLLFQSFPRPIVTNNDIGDVGYSGGLQGHVPGVAKTSYQGSITLLETETGIVNQFAELVLANGGSMDCDYYDGRPERFTKVYELLDCAFTFEPGDMQADGRSQVLTISGSVQYMYFGDSLAVGGGNVTLPGQRLINGANTLLNRAQQVLGVAQQGMNLFGQIQGLIR